MILLNFKNQINYILSIFILYISFVKTCDVCNNIGDECLSNESCINSVCIYTSTIYNSSSIKKCAPYMSLNEKCLENQCADGLFCEFDIYPVSLGDTGTCRNNRYALIGENCTDLKSCSSFFANCINGKCVSNNNKCYINYDCAYGQFCNSTTSICETIKQENQDCTDNSCDFGLFCSKTTNKCQKYFTLQLNEPCNQNSQFECDSINNNLYCSTKNICEDLITIYNSTATKLEPINCNEPSYNSSTCNDYFYEGVSICGCDKNCHTLKNLNIKNNKSFQDLSSCFLRNNCTFIRNIQSSKSCIYKYCSKEYCNYLSLINENDSYFSSCSLTGDPIASLHICNSSYIPSDSSDFVNNSNNNRNIYLLSILIFSIIISIII